MAPCDQRSSDSANRLAAIRPDGWSLWSPFPQDATIPFPEDRHAGTACYAATFEASPHTNGR